MPGRLALPLLALFAASAFAGCSDGSDGDQTQETVASTSSAPDPSVDPSDASRSSNPSTSSDTACGLLTVDQVGEAVGGPVRDGTATGGSLSTSDTTGCSYGSVEDPTDKASVYVYSTTDLADSAFASGGTEVGGIGDRAVLVDTGSGAVVTVWFTLGTKSGLASWSSYNTTVDEGRDKSVALAKVWVAALGAVES